MLVAQGGAYAGWSLYLHEGRPAYCYNFFGLQRFKIHGEQPVPAGEHQIRMEFAYDGGGLGNGGDVTLYVDGDKVGEGRVSTPCQCSTPRTRRLTSVATAQPQSTTTTGPTTASQVGCAGSKSTSTTRPRALDHLISPTSACASRWRASRLRSLGQAQARRLGGARDPAGGAVQRAGRQQRGRGVRHQAAGQPAGAAQRDRARAAPLSSVASS